MFKKISLGVLGLVFVLAPLAVSAQSADVQAQLASLLAQLAQLQLQLGQAQTTQTTSVVTGGTVPCPNPALTRSLSRGATGTDVAALQNFLINTGYLSAGNVTGFFGPLTEAALQRFQAAEGIISYGTPDTTGYGYVGPKTRYAIVQVCTTPINVNPVIPPPPPPPPPVQQTQNPATFTTFTAIPSIIAPGQQSTLTWNVQNASGCVLNQQVPGLASATVNVNLPVSGTAIVAPSTSIVYTIVCTAIGIQNLGAIQSIGVTVTGSATTGTTGTNIPWLSISVNPSVITVGSTATLSWSAVNVTACGIQSSPSVFSSNTVSGSQSSVFNTVGTTTFTFTCTKNSQTYASTTALVVTALPSTLTASPTTGTVPLYVTFSGNAGTSDGLRIDYGDGTNVLVCAGGTSCGVYNTYHTYTTPGTYTVALTGTSNTNIRLGTATIVASAVGPSLISDKSTYTVGDSVLATWNDPATTNTNDFITYAPVGTTWDDISSIPSGWPTVITDGAHNWTKSLTPNAAGTFELQYYTAAGDYVMSSAPFTVKTPYFGLSSDKSSYTGGSNIHITWKNPYTPTAKDWLTMVPSGAHYASSTWPTGVFPKTYTGGAATGVKDFQVPTIPGQYDLVYYANDTFNELMRSTSTVSVSN